MFPAPLNGLLSGSSLPREAADDDEPLPARFSLLALFAVSTGAAVYCGLLRLLGVYAVMLMLAVLIALFFVSVDGHWRAVKRLTSEMLAGIVLPLGCLVFDPGLFRGHGSWAFADSVAIYTLLGSEMLVLFVWLLVGGAFNPLARRMAAGVLTLGSLICLALGIILFVPGCFLLVLLREPIGLLAAAPWFTLLAFRANARRARGSSAGPRASAAGILLGIVLLLALTLAVGFGVGIALPHAQGIPAAKIGAWQNFPHHD